MLSCDYGVCVYVCVFWWWWWLGRGGGVLLLLKALFVWLCPCPPLLHYRLEGDGVRKTVAASVPAGKKAET